MTAVGLAAVGYVTAVDPGPAGHYPGCPLLWLTGWYCPGCGGLRAVHALGHGDVGAAFGFNPLLVVLLPVALGLYAGWARRTWRTEQTGRPGSGRHQPGGGPGEHARLVIGVAGLALAVAFWVFRNLPAGAWAAP